MKKARAYETRVGGGGDGEPLIGVVILSKDVCEIEIRIRSGISELETKRIR